MKLLKSILAICMAFTLITVNTTVVDVHATDFTGKEREYIAKCNRNDMSNSDIKLCQEFNQYLNNKNNQIKKDISKNEEDLTNTQQDISALLDQIQSYDTQISLQQDQINYFSANISSLEASIAERDQLVKDRMYLMQDYVNVNYFIDFIIKASSLTDLFKRIESVVDITGADKSLLEKMNADKKELQIQKDNLETSKETLEALRSESNTRKEKLEALASELATNLDALYAQNEHSEAELGALTSAINASIVNQEQIAAAKAAAEAAAKAAAEAEAKRKAEEEAKRQQELLQQQQQAAQQQQKPTTSTPAPSPAPAPTPTPTPAPTPAPAPSGGATAAALGAMNYALARQGYPYSWGGTGPSSYDCSGLMMAAYASQGISIGRTTYQQCVRGIAVSWDQLLPGDLLFWCTLSGAQPSHVGMYIGNGLMIHAGTSATGVIVSNINTSYWIQKRYCARRVSC